MRSAPRSEMDEQVPVGGGPSEDHVFPGKEEVAAGRRGARRQTARKHRSLGFTAPVLLGVVLLVLWDAAARSGAVSTFFLPTPSSVARELVSQLHEGVLLDYTVHTLIESAAGSGLGVAVALPLAYLIARSRTAAAALQPYVAASQAVPAVALAPLLALWLGYGLLPIAVLCALLVFFPIVVSTLLGLRSIDRDVMDAARVDGVSALQMLRHIEWPLALPGTLAGMRAGLTLSLTGAVVGEFVVGGDGLGQLLTLERSAADTVGLFATLLVLTTLAACLHGLMLLLERWARW